MDFHSDDNFLWDQNIISHNLSYNINDELTREMRRMDQDGPHSGAAQRKFNNREHFTGSRKALACYITNDVANDVGPKSSQLNSVVENTIVENTNIKRNPLDEQLDQKSNNICGIVNNTVSSINKDMTDLFGKNWQFIFLVILIAICVMQYLHYRHTTTELVDLIKLLMVKNYESELVEIPQNIRQDIQKLNASQTSQVQQVKPSQVKPLQTNQTQPQANQTTALEPLQKPSFELSDQMKVLEQQIKSNP